jgi:hypothetical protein
MRRIVIPNGKMLLQQINEYETFTDVGHHTKAKIPNGYKKIRVHFDFDVIHDGRHKARLVADDTSLKFHWNLSTLELLVYKGAV